MAHTLLTITIFILMLTAITLQISTEDYHIVALLLWLILIIYALRDILDGFKKYKEL